MSIMSHADQINRVENLEEPSTNTLIPAEKKSPKRDADARGRILDIALKSFANRGFDGVSTTELAKAAGVTQPLIHYHFKSKKALWQTVVRNSFAVLNEEYIQPLHQISGCTSLARAERAIEDFVGFVARRTEFVKILMSESTQSTARLEWLSEELLEPCMQDLQEAYKEGVNLGILVDMPMAQLFSLVLGAASQFFVMGALNETLFKVDVSLDDHIKIHTSTVVKMLKRALIITS